MELGLMSVGNTLQYPPKEMEQWPLFFMRATCILDEINLLKVSFH